MKVRTYSDLRRFSEFQDRYEYLKLSGVVGRDTFGFDRHINQRFYRSAQWKSIRHHVIVRDRACDLGIDGYEIHSDLVIHHMNPMIVADLESGEADVLDPEFLITTTHRTHNAIHYGTFDTLPKPYVPRARGDTKLWGD